MQAAGRRRVDARSPQRGCLPPASWRLSARLFEIPLSQLRLLFQSLLPAVASLVLFALALEDVSQVEKSFGEGRPLLQCFFIQAFGIVQLARFLQQQSSVIKQLGAALALVDQ